MLLGPEAHEIKFVGIPQGQSTFLPPIRSVKLVTKTNNQNVEFMLPITLRQHEHVFVLVCFY